MYYFSRLMERVRQFSVVDPDVLSLAEMCSIRSGFYVKELTQIVQESKEHILACKVREASESEHRENGECTICVVPFTCIPPCN